MTKVHMEGPMEKKGGLLKRYKGGYYFYVEGSFLKYRKDGKKEIAKVIIDLRDVTITLHKEKDD
jgi:hypothetical protein